MTQTNTSLNSGKPPAPPDPSNTNTSSRTWSSIASLNVSKRNKTNTLEIRLENDQTSKGCSLNSDEIEKLLRRLNIEVSQFTSVQACPERKNVVFITLANGIDANKFISSSNESFILKPGMRTTTIKHANRKEVNVQIFGLHPDTKDEAVIRYLNAHGKVDVKIPVIYGIYPGNSGSLLAGKRNGNRTYSMEVTKNIGSTHVIDGEKVSIKYPGQVKTCNKCHQVSPICPGKGLARNCTADKVLLSEHMLEYWKTINFVPDTRDMNEVDEEVDIETVDQEIDTFVKASMKNDLASRYSGVVIKGFKKDTQMELIIDVLKDSGLPLDYAQEDLQVMEKSTQITIHINDLNPETCVNIINNLHGKIKLDHRISVFSLVEETPVKKNEVQDETSTANDDKNVTKYIVTAQPILNLI